MNATAKILVLVLALALPGVPYAVKSIKSRTEVQKVSVNSASIPWTVRVDVIGPDGKIKESRITHNTVTNTGLTDMLNRTMSSSSSNVSNFAGIGTGVGGTGASCTVSAFTQTALDVEVGTRIQQTSLTVTNPANGQRVGTLVFTFPASNPNAANSPLCEIGLFTASSAGNMFLRTKMAVVNKGLSDTLQVTAQVTLTAS